MTTLNAPQRALYNALAGCAPLLLTIVRDTILDGLASENEDVDALAAKHGAPIGSPEWTAVEDAIGVFADAYPGAEDDVPARSALEVVNVILGVTT